MRFLSRYSLLCLCLAILLLFMVYPVVLGLVGGLQEVQPDGNIQWTWRYVAEVFLDPLLRRCLLNSLWLACLVTLASLAIALPLARLSTRYNFWGKSILSALLLVPLILPPFVGAIGLRMLLGRYGAVNSLLIDWGYLNAASPIDFLGGGRFISVVLMEALHLYPVVLLNVAAAMANLDPALEQAAENLGASRSMIFRRVVLPLILPGVFAGGSIVFIWSFTELGTPLMFDYYNVLPVQIFRSINELANNPQPYAMVLVMLTLSVIIYTIVRLVLGNRSYAMNTRAFSAAGERQLGIFKSALVAIPFLIVIALALLPHLGLVITSFAGQGSWYRHALPTVLTTANYTAALGHPLASGSIANSLQYASLAMIVDLILGLLIAYLIVRTTVRGRLLLDSLSMMPLAVPGLVLAFGYVAMSLSWPLRGPMPAWLSMPLSHALPASWMPYIAASPLAGVADIIGQSPNPIVFLVIAYAIRRLPYVVRAAASGLQQTSGDLEDAALNLGASRLYAIRRVVVPLIAANLIAGGILAFSFAMLEVSDSLILAQSEQHYPITKAIYILVDRLGDGPYIASAMGVWGMALLTVTLVAASLLLGKKLGAVFRL